MKKHLLKIFCSILRSIKGYLLEIDYLNRFEIVQRQKIVQFVTIAPFKFLYLKKSPNLCFPKLFSDCRLP